MGTLDASTKIHAYRVDSVYGDTLKVASVLGQAGKHGGGPEGVGEEGEEGGGEEGDPNNPDQPKKKRRLKKWNLDKEGEDNEEYNRLKTIVIMLTFLTI